MKPSFFFFVTCLLTITALFSACKKSSSLLPGDNGKDAGYYVRFKLDGQLLTDTSVSRIFGIVHLSGEAGSRNVLTITAYMDSGFTTKGQFFMSILGNGGLSLRTYRDSTKYFDQYGFYQSELQMSLEDDSLDQYSAAGLRIPATNAYPESQLTLASVDSAGAKGTFSGSLSHGSYPGGGLNHLITEGEFNVPLQAQ